MSQGIEGAAPSVGRAEAPPARQPVSPFRFGWAAVVVVTVGVHAYTLASWSWYQDDLSFTSLIASEGGFKFTFSSIAGHLAPGNQAIAWLITSIAPLDFRLAILVTCIVSAAVLIGWGLFLIEVFGERLHLLAFITLLGLAPGVFVDSLFWSRGVDVQTVQLGMVFSLWFLARFLLRGHRPRDLVGLTVSYAVGLFFWQISLLTVIPLVFLCLLLPSGDARARVRIAVRALWPVAVVTVLYLPIYLVALSSTPSPAGSTNPIERTPGGAVTFFVHGALDYVLPTLVGGPYTKIPNIGGFYPVSPGPVSLGLFAVTVVLGAVGVAYRRRGSLAIAMTVAYAVVAWGLVFASNRYEFFGEALVQAPHYSGYMLPVVLFTVAFLVTPTVVDRDDPLRRPLEPTVLRRVRTALSVYLVVILLGVTISVGRTWDGVRASSPKPWIDSVIGEARKLPKSDVVYDTRPPETIVTAVLLPAAGRLSNVLSPLNLPLRYDQPTSQYVMADANGHFWKAVIAAPATSSTPPSDAASACPFPVTRGSTRHIPLDKTLFEWPWVAEIEYFTGSEATVRVRAGNADVRLDLTPPKAGEVARRQFLLPGAIDDFSVDGLTGESTVCITKVTIGELSPSDQRPAGLPPVN